MSFFSKLTAPKEVRALLGILDEIACTRVSQSGITIPSADTWHDSEAFQIVRKEIEKIILAHPDEFARMVQDGTSPREWVWAAISNIAGNHVESGEYHIYRGFLNPLGPGQYLMKLYDTALDELTRMGAMQLDHATEEKSALRKNIRDVG
jgi:hypothetical protein